MSSAVEPLTLSRGKHGCVAFFIEFAARIPDSSKKSIFIFRSHHENKDLIAMNNLCCYQF